MIEYYEHCTSYIHIKQGYRSLQRSKTENTIQRLGDGGSESFKGERQRKKKRTLETPMYHVLRDVEILLVNGCKFISTDRLHLADLDRHCQFSAERLVLIVAGAPDHPAVYSTEALLW